MSLTLEELKEEIVREYDVVLLCEVLDITPEDILEAFEDKLIINRDKFTEDTEDET
jgi:DNA-binding Xre family transcriptional regulator|tara:strand:+ start:442 stop:609 length:168 start_codon:yes stop_codon:yes gene_type:complete